MSQIVCVGTKVNQSLRMKRAGTESRPVSSFTRASAKRCPWSNSEHTTSRAPDSWASSAGWS